MRGLVGMHSMTVESIMLQGSYIRLEPLQPSHAEALVAAAKDEPQLYQWTHVPRSRAEASAYIATALSWREAGTALPFATVRLEDGVVVGSTRFFNLEYWAWPAHHARHGTGLPDVLEIGYTWLARSAIRTAVNTEAKLLMLAHAFETWKVLRVCLHTDLRNLRSQEAIARIGGMREGVLRAHRLASDSTPRDSARYSIIAKEWQGVKERLKRMLM
jgi:RimJ/RimL family protein N-acetyltransferase